MADENAHPLESRTPLPSDLVKICRSLDENWPQITVGTGMTKQRDNALMAPM